VEVPLFDLNWRIVDLFFATVNNEISPSHNFISAFSAYLCVLCVKWTRNAIFNAEHTEIRRERREDLHRALQFCGKLQLRMSFAGKISYRQKERALTSPKTSALAFISVLPWRINDGQIVAAYRPE
jgi:hypothetical protein